MLTISQIDDQLLLRPRIEAEIRLIGEILHVEQHLYEGRFRHERLRLFTLAAIHSRLFPVGYVRLSISVHDLEQTRIDHWKMAIRMKVARIAFESHFAVHQTIREFHWEVQSKKNSQVALNSHYSGVCLLELKLS